MKCTVCGGEFSDGLSVCPICGMAVSSASGSGAETPKAKYTMAGGNAAPANPFGMDPSNKEARAAQEQALRGLEMEARILDDEPGSGAGGYGAGAYGAGAYGAGAPGAGGYGAGPYGPGNGPEQRPLDFSAFESSNDPFRQMVGGAKTASPPKNNNTTLIVILSVAIASVVVLLVLWKTGVIGGGNHGMNGTYQFSNAVSGTQILTADQFKQYGMDVSDFMLEVDGNNATVRLLGRSGVGKIEFEDGGKVTIKDAREEFTGTYSVTEGTITLVQDGVSLVFKRVE